MVFLPAKCANFLVFGVVQRRSSSEACPLPSCLQGRSSDARKFTMETLQGNRTTRNCSHLQQGRMQRHISMDKVGMERGKFNFFHFFIIVSLFVALHSAQSHVAKVSRHENFYVSTKKELLRREANASLSTNQIGLESATLLPVSETHYEHTLFIL